MRIFTSSIAIAAFVSAGTITHAGGLSPEVMEAPVVMEETMEQAPAASSISPLYIIGGLIAAALIYAALEDDDDDDETDTQEISDIRLKTDITEIGMTDTGLPLYSYRYIGHDALFSGVMAQDVLAHTPEAIIKLPGGLMAVDYGMLGLSMERLD